MFPGCKPDLQGLPLWVRVKTCHGPRGPHIWFPWNISAQVPCALFALQPCWPHFRGSLAPSCTCCLSHALIPSTLLLNQGLSPTGLLLPWEARWAPLRSQVLLGAPQLSSPIFSTGSAAQSLLSDCLVTVCLLQTSKLHRYRVVSFCSPIIPRRSVEK